MTEDELRKFDKETLVQFIFRTQRQDEYLTSCLNSLEVYVVTGKLLDKSKSIHDRLTQIQNDNSKFPEYLRLLKQSIRIGKKLNKIDELRIKEIEKK